MTDKIRTYIEQAFTGISQTHKVTELKEELYSHSVETYNEQLQNGKTETEACRITIEGIGDLTELVESFREPYPLSPVSPAERSRRAILVAVAIGLYCISPFTIFLFPMNNPSIGLFAMFFCIALATGLLVFNFMTRKTYQHTNNTVVEEFKEFRVTSYQQKQSISRSFFGAFWCLVVAVYFFVSFLFCIWSYSWIIFIIAAAIQNIFTGILQLRGERK